MFEAYALVQAQDQLKLGDDKYPQFLIRFKALQDTRRRMQQQHNRLLQELRRLANDGDENQIKDQLKALHDLDTQTRGEVQKAHRLAPTGISLRHSEHFLVVGSAGGSLRERAISALRGTTTKK